MLSALKPPRLKLPLIPISSEYERLLVDETAPDVGGGPMDLNATADEVLADATVADEGLAEKLMSRLFTTRGLILCTVLVVAALCVGVLRGAYESDEASLAAKATEGMFQLTGVSSRDADVHHAQRGGQGHAKIEEGDSIPVEERFAPRAAAMPREDDGRAQRLVEEVAASRGKRSAVRAALDARSRVAKHPEKKREVAELGRVDASRGISAKTVSAKTRGEDAIDRDEEPFARESTAGIAGRRRRNAKDEIDEDEDIPAVEPEEKGRMKRGHRRRASRRNAPRAEVGERDVLPVVRATRMEHGATHREALAQLEASIRSSVKEAHARRFRAYERKDDEDA